MVQTDEDDNDGLKDLTVRQGVQLMMQELVDVRRELKEEIAEVKHSVVALEDKLTEKINGLDVRLTKKIDTVTFKLDQNTVALMANINDHEKRIARLEVAAV